MLTLNTKVLIIGDSRCNVGTEVTVSGFMAQDLGDHGMRTLYRVEPQQQLAGVEVFFQEQHLMPLDKIPTLELTHFEMEDCATEM